jgi:predicted mannosyl-3-phosphoglycerate phosphatase (HAD superfamily)
MNTQTIERQNAGHLSAPGATASLVLITTIDGTLRERTREWCAPIRDALATLGTRGVPVVVMSDRPAAEVIELRRALGLRDPFICGADSAVYVPRGYFEGLTGFGRADAEWEVIKCGLADASPDDALEHRRHAIRRLLSLYHVRAGRVVTIGIGSEWADRILLREVDAPIVVRREDADQTTLLRKVPSAYLTMAYGPAGWTEAVLGSVEA